MPRAERFSVEVLGPCRFWPSTLLLAIRSPKGRTINSAHVELGRWNVCDPIPPDVYESDIERVEEALGRAFPTSALRIAP